MSRRPDVLAKLAVVALTALAFLAHGQQIDYVSQVRNVPVLNAADYAFSSSLCSNCGGSITGSSSVTVTFSRGPLGVNGSDSKHYLYLSGGTGTPESVLITGGTCTSGSNSSCTLQFTPANNHSGAWTLGSATSGLQEAGNLVGTSPLIRIVTSGGNVHACATFPNPTWIQGNGKYIAILNVDSAMTSTCVFNFTSSGLGRVSDLEILYPSGFTPSSGATAVELGAHDADVSNLLISGVNNYGPDIGIDCTGSAICRIQDTDIYEPKTYGVQSGTAAAYWRHVTATCGDPNQCTAAFHIVGGNTFYMVDCSTEEGTYGVYVDVTAAAGGLGDAFFINTIVDNANAQGFYFLCHSSCTEGGDRIDLRGGQIATAASVAANGIAINAGGVSNAWTNMTIENFGVIAQTGSQASILVQGLTHGKIANNVLTSADDSAGTGINFSTYASTGVDVTGNTILTIPTVGSTCEYQAIYMDSQSHADILVNGNRLCAGTATFSDTNTSGALQVTISNQIMLTPPTQTSGTAQAILPDPLFYLSGTGAPTSVTGLASGRPRKFVFIATNASPGAWTAGATIGNTFTPTQNVPVNCDWDGTKVYCKP